MTRRGLFGVLVGAVAGRSAVAARPTQGGRFVIYPIDGASVERVVRSERFRRQFQDAIEAEYMGMTTQERAEAVSRRSAPARGPT